MQSVRVRLRALAVPLALAVAAALAMPGVAGAVEVSHVRTTLTETTGNGDGLVGPGETFSLTERIRHDDLLYPQLTGVSGTLSESSTDLTLFEKVSGYPDVAFGAETQNSTAFTGQVAAGSECGAGYDLQLSVSSAQGTGQVPFRISSGAPGPTLAYDSADVPRAIPDLTTVESNLDVAATGRIKDVAVRLGDLRHTATGDLKVEVVAPDGTAVVLVDSEDASGDDFVNTVFSDAAAQRVAGASAPFTGSYRPEQALSALAGRSPQGQWKLRVTDKFGSDTGQLNAWGLDVRTAVCNGSPIASFTASPQPVLPGQTLTLDASGSTDPNGTIAGYEWDLDNDGSYDDGTTQTLTTTFPTRGRKPVGLRVTDDRGDTGTTVVQISVTDPPVAAFSAAPASPLTGETTTLDASGSSDPDDAPLERYEWDLDGDGEFERDGAATPTTTAQWASPGSRTVRVRVTDEDGATDVHSADVVVRNRPPIPAFTHPVPVLATTAVTFDARGTTDSDSSLVRYEWDFDGNGVYEHDAGAQPTTQHAFPGPGDVVVGLRVTDAHGGSATTTRTVAVTLAPSASFSATPNPVSLDRAVAFDASASRDDDGAIVRHEWDLDGNGSYETDTGVLPVAGRAYAAAGTYAVRLRVTDDDGATATATVSLTAANTLPTAAIAATPATLNAGESTLLDARGSGDPDGTIVRYDWDLDGNGTFETTTGGAPVRSHTYPNAGAFTVGVRVTDNHGGMRSATTPVVVRATVAGPTAPGAPG
ncbi:MAG: PKD domain-containing protein, partial [Actinomycetota bacterium]|nr:PKD domain-containing protein [Actinomycetota bacterium]